LASFLTACLSLKLQHLFACMFLFHCHRL
jgi:hypothetical protein